MDAHLDIQLLGGFRLNYGGNLLTEIDTPRLQSLFAYLLLHKESPIPRKLLAFIYWPDSTESQAHNNLRSLLHRLRNTLPDADNYIEHTSSWIRWRCDSPYKLDVSQFLAAVEIAASITDPSDQARALSHAIDQYTGDLLPSCYEEWILPLRDHYQETFIDNLEKLTEILEGQREFSSAIRHAQKHLRTQPLRESAYRRLMRLHALNGDRASGLYVYHTCVRVLQNELGVTPSMETRTLYDQLLNVRETASLDLPEIRSPFVGRIHSWKKLVSAWRKQSTGNQQPSLVLIAGEAGIGKTRLAEEFIQWAHRQGITTATANAYPSERQLAYAPVISWLRSLPINTLPTIWLTEIARLAPDLVGGVANNIEERSAHDNWQRRQIFEAIRQAVILQRKPIILFLDDVHWADGETIEWLHYLLRSGTNERLMVIVTARNGSLNLSQPLQLCLTDLQHQGRLLEINLERLTPKECQELARGIARRDLPMAVINKLYQHSEGNPFFLEETIHAVKPEEPGSEILADFAGSDMFNLSPKIHNLLSSRLDELSSNTRAIVDIATILGRSFNGSVLAIAANVDEGLLLQALDELWQRRIVRERGDDTYDFSHDLLRLSAFSALSPARRQLLHRRAAQAMQYVYQQKQDEMSSQIAIQYDAGGLLAEAIDWYQRASRHARKIYALQESVAHLQRAADLLPKVGVSGNQSLQVFEDLGDGLAFIGKHKQARQAYERALEEIISTEDQVRSANLWRKIGNVEKSALRYPDSTKAYKKALSIINPGNPPSDDQALSTYLDIELDHLDLLYLQHDLDSMSTSIDYLSPIISRSGSILQKSNFAASQVMLSSRQERFVLSEKTLGLTHKALEMASITGDIYQIAYKRFSLGFVMLWHGDLVGAETCLKQSLNEARRIGHIPLQDRCLAYLCILYRIQGLHEPLQDLIPEHLKVAHIEANSLYLGVANANLAWLAHSAGDQDRALQLARQALKYWRSSEYPFHWLVLFLLLANALREDDLPQAVKLAADTLAPTQQVLPESLTGALQAVIDAWDRGEIQNTSAHIKIALKIARESNFY